MTTLKKDAALIKGHLKALRQATWLGPSRQWWPDYLFHFADLANAINIIKDGQLESRSRGRMATDSASSQIIGQTEEEWKGYVRLYFRPRTPTLYHNEGFRPRASLTSLQAHCPMPVYFLFDAVELLTRQTTKFSDGNLAAAGCNVGEDAAFFKAIPFEKVYHDSWLDEFEKRNIVYHRHAEVLVPDVLDLTNLKGIICRTEAELRTLRHLLNGRLFRKFAQRTRTKPELFHQRWTFVETAELEQAKVTLRFNRNSLTPEPFVARLEIKDLNADKSYFWENTAYRANDVLSVTMPQIKEPTSYEARFTLDGVVAYADLFLSDEIPF